MDRAEVGASWKIRENHWEAEKDVLLQNTRAKKILVEGGSINLRGSSEGFIKPDSQRGAVFASKRVSRPKSQDLPH